MPPAVRVSTSATLCRQLRAAGQPLTLPVRERLVACMYLSRVLPDGSIDFRDPQGHDLALASDLDRRFDARAYLYVQVCRVCVLASGPAGMWSSLCQFKHMCYCTADWHRVLLSAFGPVDFNSNWLLFKLTLLGENE